MSKSRNDLNRRNRDLDRHDSRRDIQSRGHHLQEKRYRNALHTRNIDAFIDEDEEE